MYEEALDIHIKYRIREQNNIGLIKEDKKNY